MSGLAENSTESGARRETAGDYVFRILREDIIRGELKEREPLRQAEIARRLGVSHIPVREALRRLEAEGLAASIPNRGAVVAELSVEELRDRGNIRLFLEQGALQLALPALTEDDLAEAGRALDMLEREEDLYRRSRRNWAFHEALYRPCRSPRMVALIGEQYVRFEFYLRAYRHLDDVRADTGGEHRRLLAACRERNEAEALGILAGHIRHVVLDIERYLCHYRGGSR